MIVVPSRMGRLNKRALLSHLRRMGTASRADLAKSLGLSQPTAGKIVDELLELGVFEEVTTESSFAPAGNHRTKAGRPARMLRLNRSQPHFLAIQLGIQNIDFAQPSIGDNGEDRWVAHVATPGSARDLLRELRATAAAFRGEKFWGVLVSVPGVVDERTPKIMYSPNLHWTEQADLPALLRQVWKVPVVLVQEEHALALGHQAVDAEGEDFLLVDFGEGVGGAVVMAGKLSTHPLPISGELGHTPVMGNERRCGCGGTGCLETLVSTRGLVQSFAAAHPDVPRPDWQTLRDGVAARGVESWLAHTLEATAGVIAGALNVLGLRRVILTGAINELPPTVPACLSAAISRGALWARFGEMKVEAAPRRRVAGLVAAGLDQLVIPMAEAERNQETQLHISASHS